MIDAESSGERQALIDLAHGESELLGDSPAIRSLLAKNLIQIENDRYRLTGKGSEQLAWYFDHALDS